MFFCMLPARQKVAIGRASDCKEEEPHNEEAGVCLFNGAYLATLSYPECELNEALTDCVYS
jgi:hypothetical protein